MSKTVLALFSLRSEHFKGMPIDIKGQQVCYKPLEHLLKGLWLHKAYVAIKLLRNNLQKAGTKKRKKKKEDIIVSSVENQTFTDAVQRKPKGLHTHFRVHLTVCTQRLIAHLLSAFRCLKIQHKLSRQQQVNVEVYPWGYLDKPVTIPHSPALWPWKIWCNLMSSV